MTTLRRFRWPAIIILSIVCVVPGIALASSAQQPKGHGHDLTVSQPARKANATSNTQFSTTANPLTLDPPVVTPPTQPNVVTVLNQQPFANANTVQQTVTLPSGHWAEVVLHVDGQQSGRQYDRLMQVYVGSVPLFVGVTPEPTAAGITWKLTKDISDYLPVLQGQQVFSVNVDNYPNSLDNGIPKMSVSLWFYPGAANAAQSPADAASPNSIVPVGSSGATTLDTVNANQSLQATVTLPHDLTRVMFNFYGIPQINEEFWWGMEPSFREIEVAVDGKPAGLVWPFPYIYTGGVNPLLWRPITALHTLDIPAYQVDLTPFAGLLGGQHTITLTVQNNTGYWLMGGSLFLGEDGGKPTSGKLLTDTLTFPTTAASDTSNALGSPNNAVTGQEATKSYEIKGQITTAGGAWVDDLTSSLQFSNDQTNITDNYLQYLHGEQVANTTEVLQDPQGAPTTWKESDTYTVDAPSAFLQQSGTNNFFLPAQVTQSHDVKTSVQVGNGAVRASHLYENVEGYSALEEDNSAPTITDGSTTGDVTYENAQGQQYQRLVVARGGVILHDDETNGLSWHP